MFLICDLSNISFNFWINYLVFPLVSEVGFQKFNELSYGIENIFYTL